MKKMLVTLLSVVMMFSMLACGSDTPETTADARETKAGEKEETTAGNETKAVETLIAGKYLTGDYVTLPAEGEVYTLVMAHANAETSVDQTRMLAFKEAIEYYSDGKILITIYPNGQLGSDAETITSCVAGNIDMVYQAGSTHSSIVPETMLFDTPFLLSSYDKDVIMEEMINSSFRDMYDAANEAGGLVCLLSISAEPMYLTSNKEIKSMDDLAGVKIRTNQSESRMATWQALGANPTPLAFSELYMALQNGTVEAQETTLANAISSASVEQQDYIMATKHIMPARDLVINKNKFDSLPKEYQQLLKEVSDDVARFCYQNSYEQEEIFMNQILNEYDVTLIEISDDFMNQMIEAAQPAAATVKEKVGNDAIYECLENDLK